MPTAADRARTDAVPAPAEARTREQVVGQQMREQRPAVGAVQQARQQRG